MRTLPDRVCLRDPRRERVIELTAIAQTRRTAVESHLACPAGDLARSPRKRTVATTDQLLTENNLHGCGIPLRACSPRSSKLMPDPATRSTTVRETSTSPGPAVA